MTTESWLGEHAVRELIEDLNIGQLIFHALFPILQNFSLGSMLEAGEEEWQSGRFLDVLATLSHKRGGGRLPLWILVFQRLHQGLVRLAVSERDRGECRANLLSHFVAG